MSKIAVVDIDNTLWHFCDALYVELKKVNKAFPTPDNWTHWDLWEGIEGRTRIYEPHNQ